MSALHSAPRVRKAVVPAAGLGTRFLPATKATPKEMLPVVDKPAIQYVVEEAAAAGLDDVLMVTGRAQAGHRGPLRPRPRTGAGARRQGRHRAAGRGARPLAARRHPPHPAGRPARPGSRRPVRPQPRRRPAVRRPARRRPDRPARDAAESDAGRPRPVRGQRRRPDGGAARSRSTSTAARPSSRPARTALCASPASSRSPRARTHRAGTPSSAAMSSTRPIFDVLERTEPGRGGEIQLTDALQELAAAGTVHGVIFSGPPVRHRRQGGLPAHGRPPGLRPTRPGTGVRRLAEGLRGGPGGRRRRAGPVGRLTGGVGAADDDADGPGGPVRPGRGRRPTPERRPRGGEGRRPSQASTAGVDRTVSAGDGACRRRCQPLGRRVHVTVISPVTAPSARRISIATGNSGRSPASSCATTSAAGRPRVAVAVTAPIASFR